MLQKGDCKLSIIHKMRPMDPWKVFVTPSAVRIFVCSKCDKVTDGAVEVLQEVMCDKVETMKRLCYLGNRLNASGDVKL